MHSVCIGQLVGSAAVPLVMCMHGYKRGVATVWIYPYPAERLDSAVLNIIDKNIFIIFYF